MAAQMSSIVKGHPQLAEEANKGKAHVVCRSKGFEAYAEKWPDIVWTGMSAMPTAP